LFHGGHDFINRRPTQNVPAVHISKQAQLVSILLFNLAEIHVSDGLKWIYAIEARFYEEIHQRPDVAVAVFETKRSFLVDGLNYLFDTGQEEFLECGR
jgi:hypothetical protein